MRFSREVIEYLRTQFVTRHGKSTIDDHLTPSADDTVNLGAASYRWDTLYARNVVAENLTGSGGSADTVDGFHAYATPNANELLALDGSSKFPVSAITQGHSSGLDADTLDTLQPSNNPGASANILQSDSGGGLTLKKFFVTGLADEIQATFKPYSGQNASVFKVTDSGDATKFEIAAAGNIGINVVPATDTQLSISKSYVTLPGTRYGERLIQTLSPTANLGSATLAAFHISLSMAGSDSLTHGGTRYGFQSQISVESSSAWNNVVGNYLSISHTTAKTPSLAAESGYYAYLNVEDASITTLRGVYIAPRIDTGSVGTFYGLHVSPTIVGSGSFTTYYGIKLESISATSPFAIHTGTGKVSLGDDLQFRQAAEISTTTSTLKLNPNADLLTDPGSNYILPVTNFDVNIGSISKKYLTLHAAELVVETLVAQDTIASIGGRVMVTETTKLIADCGTGDGLIDVEHNFLTNGDRVFLQADGKFECMGITSSPTAITGGYRYNVTRNLDGTGANQWYAGDAIVNTGGSAGPSHIELYSLRSHTARPLEHIYIDDESSFSDNLCNSSFFALFPAIAVVNDAIYFGMENTKWSNLFFYVQAGTFDATFAYEFYNGSIWTALTTTATPDFASTGFTSLEFAEASQTGWAQTSVNSVNAYWVRIRVATVTSWTTTPEQRGRRVYNEKRTYGPTIVGHYRKSSTWNDIEACWAVGNLSGLYNQNPDTFGIGLGLESGVHAVYTTTAINFYDGSNNSVSEYGASSVRIGQTTEAHITLDTTNGIEILDNTTKKVSIQADGDVFIGSDITAPASTNLIVFSNDQTYNGESVYAGDLLIGDNSSNKANVLWDKSAGELLFRTGITSYIKINSSGQMVAGGGHAILDDNGFTQLGTGQGVGESYRIAYNDSGTWRTTAKFLTDYQPGVQNTNTTWLIAYRNSTSPWTKSNLFLRATDSVAGYSPTIYLYGTDNKIEIGGSRLDITTDCHTYIDAILYLAEQSAHPGTPSSGWGGFYVFGVNGSPWFIDDAGTSIQIAQGHVKDLSMEGAYLIGATFVLLDNFNNTVKFRNGVSDIAHWSLRAANVWVGKTIAMIIRYLHITASPTGNVRFHWDYTINRNDATRLTSPSADGYKTQAVGSQYQWKVWYKEISAAGIQAGDGLTVRLYREGAHADDTNSDDVYVGSVQVGLYWA